MLMCIQRIKRKGSKHGQVYQKNKMLWYTKMIKFLGQTPNSSSKVLFELDFFIFLNGTLYCCVRYSNLEYQDEIFKTYR